jgi:hypothetical protein
VTKALGIKVTKLFEKKIRAQKCAARAFEHAKQLAF